MQPTRGGTTNTYYNAIVLSQVWLDGLIILGFLHQWKFVLWQKIDKYSINLQKNGQSEKIAKSGHANLHNLSVMMSLLKFC